jgi:hypothetical protein
MTTSGVALLAELEGMAQRNAPKVKVKEPMPIERNTSVGADIKNEELLTCIDNLMLAFRWSDTPQGAGYWAQVYDNLIKLKG